MRLKSPRASRPANKVLVELVYELLDAHDDTARLAHELTLDGVAPQSHSNPSAVPDAYRWQAHLDYLQALQRTGRGVLARVSTV
jgi:hypothetical protein